MAPQDSLRSRVMRDAACVLLLAALACAFHEASLFRGRIITLRDLTGDFGPWQTFAAARYRRGVIPLWCPHSDCGAPFLANMEPAALYPLNWLFGARLFSQGLDLYAALHTFLAAAFMFAFVRSLGLTRPAALVGGLAYAFGGWMVARLEFLPWFASLAWQPLVLLCAHRTLRSASWRWAVGWGVATAAQFLAGYPECSLLTAAAVALFVAGYALFHARRLKWAGCLRLAGLVAVAGAVAACLTAAQLLPTLELAALSDRAAWSDYRGAASRSVYPLHFLTWLVPRAFGGQGFDRYWGGSLFEFGFSCYYSGVATALLALASLRLARDSDRRWLVLTWTSIALVGMALAMGKFAPFYGWAYEHLPLLGRLRWPVKFMALAVMGVCVLASLSADALGRRPPAPRSRAWDGLVVAVAVLSILLLVFGSQLLAGPRAGASWAGRLVTSQIHTDQVSCFRRHHRLAAADAFKCLVLINLAAAAVLLHRRPAWRGPGQIALVAVLVLDLFVSTKPINWAAEVDVYNAKTPIPAQLSHASQPGRAYVPDRVLFANNWLYGLRNPAAFLWAQNALLASRNLPAGIDVVHSDYSLDVGRHRRVLELLESRPRYSPARSRLMNMLNVRWEIGARGANVESLVNMQDYARLATVVPRESKRAWVVSQVRSMDDADALQHMGSGQFDPYRTALVPRATLAASYPPWRGTLAITKLSDHETRLAVEGGPGLLVLSETFYPGWRLYDRGRRGTILRTDYTLRGAVLERGRHDLRFVYDPASVKLGFALSLLGIAGLLGWVAARRTRIT